MLSELFPIIITILLGFFFSVWSHPLRFSMISWFCFLFICAWGFNRSVLYPVFCASFMYLIVSYQSVLLFISYDIFYWIMQLLLMKSIFVILILILLFCLKILPHVSYSFHHGFVDSYFYSLCLSDSTDFSCLIMWLFCVDNFFCSDVICKFETLVLPFICWFHTAYRFTIH